MATRTLGGEGTFHTSLHALSHKSHATAPPPSTQEPARAARFSHPAERTFRESAEADDGAAVSRSVRAAAESSLDEPATVDAGVGGAGAGTGATAGGAGTGAGTTAGGAGTSAGTTAGRAGDGVGGSPAGGDWGGTFGFIFDAFLRVSRAHRVGCTASSRRALTGIPGIRNGREAMRRATACAPTRVASVAMAHATPA
jgi:hypothetical protein